MHHYVLPVPPDEFTEIVFSMARWVRDYKSSFKVRWMRFKPYLKNDLFFLFRKAFKSLRIRLLKHVVKE
jgi:hypothetical protein